MAPGCHGYAAVLLRVYGRLRSDGVGHTIELSVDVSKAGSGLLVSRGREVLIESALSGVHRCLRINDGLLIVSRRASHGGSGRRGRGSPRLGGQRRDVNRQSSTGQSAYLVLPGVAALRVTVTGQTGDIVRVVGVEGTAIETVGRGSVTRRMEAGDIRGTTGDRIELLRAVDAGELAVLGDMNADTHHVVLGEHVLIVAGGVLPLIKEGVSSLHRVLAGAIGPPLIAEVLAMVVGDVLTGVGGVATIKLASTEVLVIGIVIKVVRVGHVLAPRARICSHGIGDDQLGQPRVRTVGIHLLNDEGFDDTRLGSVVNLRPVHPVEATIGRRGRRDGRAISRVGLGRRLPSSIKGRLGIGQSRTEFGFTRRIGSGGRGISSSCSGVAGEQGVVFSGDSPLSTRQRVAECVLRRARPLGQRGDNDEGCRDCRGGENHRGMGASELERHWLPA